MATNPNSEFPYREFGASVATQLASAARNERRSERRALAILVVTVALGAGFIFYALEEAARTQPAKVVIDPAKLPPIRPGPSR